MNVEVNIKIKCESYNVKDLEDIMLDFIKNIKIGDVTNLNMEVKDE